LSAKGDKTQFLVFSAKKKKKNSPHLEFIIIMYIAGSRNYYSIYKEKKAQF